MYDEHRRTTVFISPLMSLYWFFDARKVVQQSKIAEALRFTQTFREAVAITMSMMGDRILRPCRKIPY
jgi:hypothetical protein